MLKMKIKNVFLSMLAVSAALLTTSCENADREFDDFDYQTVYFAYQNPVRTITLGDDDVYPTDLDNEHKMNVYVTLGGVWENKQDRHVKIAVDNSLVDGKTFTNGSPIVAMPENYYRLTSNEITIPSGKVMGATTVELTDAFFADAKAPSVNYVIPLKIIDASDSILESKNFTLYAVKFKNKYTGCWLSHGTDEIDENGAKRTQVREPEDFRKYNLRYLSTISLTDCTYPIAMEVHRRFKKRDDKGNVVTDPQTGEIVWEEKKVTFESYITLSFDGGDKCTIVAKGPDNDVFNFTTATGTGQWSSKAAKKAWNDKDRDQLDLNYTCTIKYPYSEDGDDIRTSIFSIKETLIMRDRQNKLETFEYK